MVTIQSMSHDAIQSIIHNAGHGSLGTISADGFPFVSMVTVAAIGNRSVAMLLSGLAVHSQNLWRDQRASLLLIATSGRSVESGKSAGVSDPLSESRVSLVGNVTKLARGDDANVRASFLVKHPSAAMYADFGDFAFYVLDVDVAHLVAGFGRIETVAGEQL